MTLFLPPEGESRLPVSLITGFLGSGKTTLLNRLLRHAEMARTAIVINEFGDVALDQVFVERSEGEVAVLANGCLCCAAQEDFEGVVGTLFAKRTRKEVPAFDRMVIETSGLADPGPIMQMLLNQPLITDNFRLDTVVATVDALHAASQLREHEIAVNQAALSGPAGDYEDRPRGCGRAEIVDRGVGKREPLRCRDAGGRGRDTPIGSLRG